MVNLYYEALYSDSRLAKNMRVAVKDNFDKIERYLDLAIDSLEKKGNIPIRWEPVNQRFKVNFVPLVKAIKIFTTVNIEVFLDNNLLELNVIDGEVFDTSYGIKLDDGWTTLRPDEFEIFSINNKRHILRLHNYSLYNGQRFASTRNGATAEIKAFEIKNIKQGNQSFEVLSVNYDETHGCYRISLQGSINDGEEININGLTIAAEDWKIISNFSGNFIDEKGQEIKIKKVVGNVLYIDRDAPLPKEVYRGSIKLPFTILELSPPTRISHEDIEVIIQQDRNGSYYTYSDVSKITDEITYYHPEERTSLFKISFNSEQKYINGRELAIRVLDDDEDEQDELITKSKIDYFAEESQSLEGWIEDKLVSFEVVRANLEEQILYIKKVDYNGPINYEDVPKELYIKVDTSQLKKQKQAIRLLKQRPLKEHKPLLTLTQKKHPGLWKDFALEEVSEWYVLNDSTREGVESQRNFVKKAISTPDFALLEGPPGSGKTTTILELILQLIKRKKKILLCASTHVAIDNVLERLKERNLLDGILPLRIGNEDQVADSVKEFCISRYENSKYKQLIVEAANLVCGTTIGILRHPLFKKYKEDKGSPAIPEYDYLIIDESSKTTFQEFLVPALFAKRWILVGDIKQLPPYNDREQIIAGIDDNQKLSPHLKKACFLLFQYVYNNKNKIPFCIVDEDKVIDQIKNELTFPQNEISTKQIAIIDTQLYDTDRFYSIPVDRLEKGDTISWILPGMDIIFVKQSIIQRVKKYIPSNMVVINQEKWEQEKHHYMVEAYYDSNPKEINYSSSNRDKFRRFHKITPTDIMREQNQFLRERTWASEYVWRMIRAFELESVEKSWKRHDYMNQLEMLLPKSASLEAIKDIRTVQSIALPSVLQSLQEGIGKNREKSLVTTLNSGFNEHEKLFRFEKLEYQHRMHKEISRFPRKQFYLNTALKDSENLDRSWGYNRYLYRNIWINVDGKTYRNSNEKEAIKVLEELKHFVNWARTNPNPQHEEGIWTVACLSFYNRQQRLLRDYLRSYTNQPNKHSKFEIGNVTIYNYTVDKFQGREADITFLSMVQTRKVGFMDNPNRLNVAVTRARFQRVIVGKYNYFLNNKHSDQLRFLAMDSHLFNESEGSHEDYIE